MDEIIRVCAIENEAESQIVCSILNEQSIPYTLKKSEDAAYDGIYAAHSPWGFIEAPLPYADSITQILKDVRESRTKKRARSSLPSQEKQKNFRQQVELGVPILLLVAVIVLVGIVVSQKRMLNRYAVRQNIIWKWDPTEKAMVGKLKSTGQLRYRDYDRNFNNVYEERVVYSLDGKRTATYYDDNEDGNPERSVSSQIDGTVVWKAEDLNESGVFEHETVYYYGQNRFVEYTDTDDDGLFDQAVVHNEGGRRSIDLRQAFFGDQP